MIRKVCPRWVPSSQGAAVVVLAAAALLFPFLTGCEKGPPTFKEIIGQGEEQKEAPPQAPAPAQPQAPAQLTPKPATPPPAPKKRTSQEVLGDFQRTRPQDRTDGLLAEMAGMEDGLDQVKVMNLSRSAVTDAGLKQLEKFDNITSLDLGVVNLTNDGLVSVSKMKNLEELSLEGTPKLSLTASDPNARTIDAGLAHIRTMPKLRSLRLTGAKFTDKGLDEVAKMNDIEALYLGNSGIGDANLVQLKGLDNLRILDLSETKITDNGFEHLMELKNLEWLDVGRNKDRIKGFGYREAVRRKGFPKLKHLSAYDTKWGDPGMEGIQGTKTLEYLDLGDTLVNDNNLKAVRSNPKLQMIYLHRNSGVTSRGLENLKGLKDLNTIYLDNTRGVNDQGLAHLTTLKKLERLVITETGCTEKGAQALKKFLPNVKIELKHGAPAL